MLWHHSRDENNPVAAARQLLKLIGVRLDAGSFCNGTRELGRPWAVVSTTRNTWLAEATREHDMASLGKRRKRMDPTVIEFKQMSARLGKLNLKKDKAAALRGVWAGDAIEGVRGAKWGGRSEVFARGA